MNYKSNLSTNDRPSPIEDENEAPHLHPKLDPIRDDPEPMRQLPHKKPKKVDEGSYEGAELYAEGISNYLKTANVQADAKAAAPSTRPEAAELEKAETDTTAAVHGHDMRDF